MRKSSKTDNQNIEKEEFVFNLKEFQLAFVKFHNAIIEQMENEKKLQQKNLLAKKNEEQNINNNFKSNKKMSRALSFSGYKLAAAKPDTEEFKSNLKSSELPSVVDLRPFMTAVEDQRDMNSCTANAVAGAYEYLVKKYLKKDAYDVSRLFIYYNARLRAGGEIEDQGSVIQYAIEGLQNMGACSEKIWAYNKEYVNEKPHKDCYASAAKFKIEDAKKVPNDLKKWKQALAEGYPIVFGTSLFESFDNATENGGIVPMPTANDVGRGSHGRHAMLCVGYSDADEVFIVRNSWGDKWGDQGYCYMPYNYLLDEKLSSGDNWIIKKAGKIPDADKAWKDTKKSVIDGGKGKKAQINTPIDETLFVEWAVEWEIEEYVEEFTEEFAEITSELEEIEEYEIEYEEEEEIIEEEEESEEEEYEEEESEEEEYEEEESEEEEYEENEEEESYDDGGEEEESYDDGGGEEESYDDGGEEE